MLYDFVKETSVSLTHGNFHETETKIYCVSVSGVYTEI